MLDLFNSLLNCVDGHVVCLYSFYRYVLESDVTFMANNTVSAGPTARFMELPESSLLTLNMITPESWMVQAVSSPYDLDNIQLQEVVLLFFHDYLIVLGSQLISSCCSVSSLICDVPPGEWGCGSRV